MGNCYYAEGAEPQARCSLVNVVVAERTETQRQLEQAKRALAGRAETSCGRWGCPPSNKCNSLGEELDAEKKAHIDTRRQLDVERLASGAFRQQDDNLEDAYAVIEELSNQYSAVRGHRESLRKDRNRCLLAKQALESSYAKLVELARKKDGEIERLGQSIRNQNGYYARAERAEARVEELEKELHAERDGKGLRVNCNKENIVTQSSGWVGKVELSFGEDGLVRMEKIQQEGWRYGY